jgi:hypothetical protein
VEKRKGQYKTTITITVTIITITIMMMMKIIYINNNSPKTLYRKQKSVEMKIKYII